MLLGFYPQIGGKPTRFKEKIHAGLKRHSMRKNKSARWKVGMAISMVYGLRTKHMERFHEATVTGLQEVKFNYAPQQAMPEIFIDGRLIGIMEAFQLATNDGFENFGDFLRFFNETETYTLIHWGGLMYNGNADGWEDANNRAIAFYGWGKQSVQSVMKSTLAELEKHPITVAWVPGSPVGDALASIGEMLNEPLVRDGVGGWCVDADKSAHGHREGQTCGRNGCKAEIARHIHGGVRACTCPIVEPCPQCLHSYNFCPECGWDESHDAGILLGTEEGEVCARNGCVGVIALGYEGDGCSCHINPPCNYCLSSYRHCPECEWDERDQEDAYHGLNEDLKAAKIITVHADDVTESEQQFLDMMRNAPTKLSFTTANGTFPIPGTFKNSICNRNGCNGVIEGYGRRQAPQYCPECGWESEVEKIPEFQKGYPVPEYVEVELKDDSGENYVPPTAEEIAKSYEQLTPEQKAGIMQAFQKADDAFYEILAKKIIDSVPRDGLMAAFDGTTGPGGELADISDNGNDLLRADIARNNQAQLDAYKAITEGGGTLPKYVQDYINNSQPEFQRLFMQEPLPALGTYRPETCTKPNCRCLEIAVAMNGGDEVKSYPCLANGDDLEQLKTEYKK